METEEHAGIKEEGLLGCKERENETASTEEALVINARGIMATTTPCNVYVLRKTMVVGY